MCYYKSDLNFLILLKSAHRMREMAFQRHKFQKYSEGGMRRSPLVVRIPRFGAAYSSFASGGKSVCDASVISEYTYRDFLKTPGFTALPYAKVCHFSVIFLSSSSVNFGTNTPQSKCPRYATANCGPLSENTISGISCRLNCSLSFWISAVAVVLVK